MNSIRRTSWALSHRSNNFQDMSGFGWCDVVAPPSFEGSFEGSMILEGAIAMNKERHFEIPMPLRITSDAPLGIKGLDGGNSNAPRTKEDEKDR